MPAAYLETRDIPIADLTLYPGNAKRGDVAAIQRSLSRNGQYRSLIVRQTDGALIVLAGNHTMQALAANGDATARCEVITCDNAEAKRINLADNRLSELGTWDDDALSALLKDVQDDLEGTGYSSDDLDELLQATGEIAAGATEFLTDFLTPEPVAAPGVAGAQPAAPGVLTPGAPAPTGAAFSDQAPPSAPPGPAQPYLPPPPVPVPTGPHMTPVQWVVTVEQRDTIRAAIKHAQETTGVDNNSAALTAVCQSYLDNQESNPS